MITTTMMCLQATIMTLSTMTTKAGTSMMIAKAGDNSMIQGLTMVIKEFVADSIHLITTLAKSTRININKVPFSTETGDQPESNDLANQYSTTELLIIFLNLS